MSGESFSEVLKKALGKDSKSFDMFLDKMLDGFAFCQIIFDQKGKPIDFVYLAINDAFERLTGLRRERVVGRRVSEAIPGTIEANPEIFEIYGRVALTGSSERFELFFKPLSIWLDIEVFSPEKGYFVAMFENITERKKADQSLREYGSVIRSASDAIFFMDNSFNIKTWNPSAGRIFGWKAEEVIGKTAISVFNPKYPTLDGTSREKALEELKATSFWEGEMIFQKKYGSSVPVSVSSSMVRDESGAVIGFVSIAHDISARRKREEALREIRHDLNHAQAVAKTGSWRLDTRRNVLSWSNESYRMFGVPLGTPLTYETFLSIVHPDDREYVDGKWKAALKGEPYDIEHRILVDGKVKWVRERAELEFDKDGTLKGGFGSAQEITDLVELRQKVEGASVQLKEYANNMEKLAEERAEKLRAAERMAAIGATAGMVGHDIRNPLQSIVGDLYLIASDLHSLPESEEKESMKESIVAIKKSVEYIDKIVNDLSDYAKPLQPNARETDLKALFEEVLKKNGFVEDVEVSFEVQEDAKKLVADAAMLMRILSNLVSNAVQSMPKGGKVAIHAFRDGVDFVITVEDTGVGISEEVKPKVFTPLFTTKSVGQGFGLPVVRRMTEALGGSVTFESEVGKGTKFIVRLPQSKKE